MSLFRVHQTGQVIDSVLCVHFPAPHSYTGEDCAELHCHGSPIVLDTGLRALFASGCRQAGPGEFTKRAFLNGQLDLLQAESVADLIDAETAQQAHNAVCQLDGALSRTVARIYDGLMDMAARFYAVVDYPDEDIEDFGAAELGGTLDRAETSLRELLATYEKGRHLRQGVRAVLLGKPNAGKSSLLNRLAGYDRVIVTDIAGTTRDTVEEPVRVGRVLLRLTDTAGIREAGDAIEALGVARSEQAAREAELALFVCDASQPLTDEDRRAIEAAKCAPRSLALCNKSDLPAAVSPDELPFDTVLTVSARTGAGLDALPAVLEGWFLGENACDGSLLTNPRQFGALDRASRAIERAKTGLCLGVTPDAVLTDVEEAMAALGEVTGRTVREDITNRIFERFCVGK